MHSDEHVKEVQLVEAIEEFLMGLDYRVGREIPNMGQSVDIVALKNRWVCCIEAKVKNWKRAIDQCRAHETVADHIYIALHGDNQSEEAVKLIKKLGYGLITVSNNSVRIAIKARKNKSFWKPQREIFVSNFNSMGDA